MCEWIPALAWLCIAVAMGTTWVPFWVMVLIGSWCWPNGACCTMVTVWRGVAAVLLWMILLAEPIELWVMPGTDSTFTKETEHILLLTLSKLKPGQVAWPKCWPLTSSPFSSVSVLMEGCRFAPPTVLTASAGIWCTTCTVCISGCTDVEDVMGVATAYVTGLIVCVNGRWTAIRTGWVVMGDAEREHKHTQWRYVN